MFSQDGWILAIKFFFCVFMNLDFVSVHKHAKKELGQYPAILTSHLVNNPYILTSHLVNSPYLLITGNWAIFQILPFLETIQVYIS